MPMSAVARVESLIPLPQSVRLEPGRFQVTAWKVACTSTDARIASALRRILPAGWKSVDSPGEASLVLRLEEPPSLPRRLPAATRAEAYRLKITPRQILLSAAQDQGLFYGLQTLAQLLSQSNRLPCGTIMDWPDLEMRGMHLTLGNGHMPTYARLQEIIRTLARFKFNNFHIEYDASFTWEKYPFIAIPSALTKDQCRNLLTLAKENFIELIPTIDSLGHQEGYLCHPQLHHLRELPHSSAELCASNPKSKAFIKDLWREVLEVHADARYVNITGDEVFRLGAHCPRCNEYARLGHQADLFFNYYDELARWMMDRGHRPMMWHDMLASHPERLREYPRELMIIYWNYWGTDARRWEVGHGLPSELLHEDVATLSPRLRKLYDPYWKQASTAPHFTPWPYLQFFEDRGFDTLGASSGSPVVEEFPFAGFRSRIKNAKSLAAGVKTAGGKGLLHTYWGSFASIETAWVDIAAAGDYSWHSREEQTESFLQRFDALCLGTGGKFTKAAQDYDHLVYPAAPPEFNIAERLPSLRKMFTVRQQWESARRRCIRPTTLLDALSPSFDLAETRLTAIRHAIGQLRPGLGRGQDTPFNLKGIFTGRTQRVIPGMTGTILNLKPGLHSTHGVAVRIADGRDGQLNAILLRGDKNPQGPEQVTVPVHGKTYDRLFFFHTSAFAGNGTEVAHYDIEFTDGGVERMPVIVGRHVGDWFQGSETLPEALVAWQGFSNAHDMGRRMVYLAWWKNTTPQRPIRRVTLATSNSSGHVTLVAITGRKFTGRQPALPAGPSAETTNLLRNQIKQFEAHYRRTYRALCVPEHIALGLKKLNASRFLPQ